jgi:hypothetical protein
MVLTANHDSRGKFAVGNQLGRGRPPVVAEFQSRCREFMTDRGWSLLVGIAEDPDDPNKFRALRLISAYAYGRPPASLELTGVATGPIELSVVYEDNSDSAGR